MNELQNKYSGKQKSHGGYTLLEMMIVVIILGVVVSALFASSGSEKLKVEAKAKEVFGLFGDAKLEAIRTGFPAIIEINGRDIRVYVDSNRDLTGTDVFDSDGTRKKPSTEDYSNGVLSNTSEQFDELYAVVNIPAGVRISQSFQAVYFDPSGRLLSVASNQPAGVSLELCEEDTNSPGNCRDGSSYSSITVNTVGTSRLNYNVIK